MLEEWECEGVQSKHVEKRRVEYTGEGWVGTW